MAWRIFHISKPLRISATLRVSYTKRYEIIMASRTPDPVFQVHPPMSYKFEDKTILWCLATPFRVYMICSAQKNPRQTQYVPFITQYVEKVSVHIIFKNVFLTVLYEY